MSSDKKIESVAIFVRAILALSGLTQFFITYGVLASPTQLWLADPLPGMYVLGGVGSILLAIKPNRPSAASAIGGLVVVTAIARSVISIIDSFHGGRQVDVLLRASVWGFIAALALGFWVTGVVPMCTLYWREKRKNG